MAPIDLSATVAEPERLHTSPVSGTRGVFFFVEVLEDDRVLGEAIFGDLVRIVVEDTVHTIAVRKIRLGFPETRPAPTPIEGTPPAELVPLLRRATGQGTLGFREHVVREGDRFRVHASRDVIFADAEPLRLDVVSGS